MCIRKASTQIGNELYASLRNELLSLSCPALTNSVLPILEVVETLTDMEPSKTRDAAGQKLVYRLGTMTTSSNTSITFGLRF